MATFELIYIYSVVTLDVDIGFVFEESCDVDCGGIGFGDIWREGEELSGSLLLENFN